jgi:hypothetical protein
MAQLVSDLVDLAAKDNLTTIDVLHRLCDEERASRLQRAVDRRIRDARFPELNAVDGFDFDFDPVRKKIRARYLALHDLAFLEKGINPPFIGLPGRGKTFLARALAYRACQGARRVVVTSAMRMLNDLAGAEVHGRLKLALRRYVAPTSSSSTTSRSSDVNCILPSCCLTKNCYQLASSKSHPTSPRRPLRWRLLGPPSRQHFRTPSSSPQQHAILGHGVPSCAACRPGIVGLVLLETLQ